MTDPSEIDLRPIYPESSPYRVRLPGSIAHALGWPTSSNEFSCYGVFRARGELLCAPQAAALEDGMHPFQAALDYRVRAGARPQSGALADFPPASTLILDLLVFDFTAKWTTAKHSQLDLNMTTLRTSLLGWRRGDQSTPVYPRIWSGVLCLLSQERVFAIQDQEGPQLLER